MPGTAPEIPAAAAECLAAGLAAQGLAADAEFERRLLAFLALLAKWNRAYNLTAVDDPHEMVTRHLLDSLAVLPWLQGPEVIDVGTGAGLPGIPLALARPDWRFWLLDGNAKKTRFCTQAVLELGLRNVEVVHARVEDFRPGRCFATVVTRAFAALPDWLARAGHLACADGVLLAMKGTYPTAELAALPSGFEVIDVLPVTVAGLRAQRHLVRVRRSATAREANG